MYGANSAGNIQPPVAMMGFQHDTGRICPEPGRAIPQPAPQPTKVLIISDALASMQENISMLEREVQTMVESCDAAPQCCAPGPWAPDAPINIVLAELPRVLASFTSRIQTARAQLGAIKIA